MRNWIVAALALPALLLLAAPAHAVEVDLSPLLDQGINLMAAVLAVVGTWIGGLVAKKLRLSADSEYRAYLTAAIEAGINRAVRSARKHLAGRPVTVEIENEIVASAVDYASAKVPDALARFKVTPEALAEMVEARLPALD